MTNIKDLETQIEGAEDALAFVKGELADLKTRLQELKEQEKDKQPEQESLFGRWATHPEYGRVIVTCDEPDGDGDVTILFRNSELPAGGDWGYTELEEITLDPVTLTTEQDFEDAPEGTIVEATMFPKDVAVKIEGGWHRAGGMHAIAVEYMPTCRVIRWGENK